MQRLENVVIAAAESSSSSDHLREREREDTAAELESLLIESKLTPFCFSSRGLTLPMLRLFPREERGCVQSYWVLSSEGLSSNTTQTSDSVLVQYATPARGIIENRGPLNVAYRWQILRFPRAGVVY